MIRWARGVSEDTHVPRTRTSRRRYRFHACADACFLGGFSLPAPVTAPARRAREARCSVDVAPDAFPVAPDALPVAPDAPPAELSAEAAELAASPALRETPPPAELTAEPTVDGVEEPVPVAPPPLDEDPDRPRSGTDDGDVVPELDPEGADTP
jgi:hypothetical protein